MLQLIVLVGAVTLVAYHLILKRLSARKLNLLSARQGCQPPKYLPQSWLLPFGLDKLRVVIAAEKLRRYPLSMLEEHEKHGDTYSQHSAFQYVIITRDTLNIREVLAR